MVPGPSMPPPCAPPTIMAPGRTRYLVAFGLVAALLLLAARSGGGGDLLNGYGSSNRLSTFQLQFALGAFCASSLPSRLMENSHTAAGSPPRLAKPFETKSPSVPSP